MSTDLTRKQFRAFHRAERFAPSEPVGTLCACRSVAAVLMVLIFLTAALTGGCEGETAEPVKSQPAEQAQTKTAEPRQEPSVRRVERANSPSKRTPESRPAQVAPVVDMMPTASGVLPIYTQWPFNADAAADRQARTAEAMAVPKAVSVNLGSDVTLELVLIPAGRFRMGSRTTEAERETGEGPVRPIRISWPFYMGTTEITQAQWRAVMGTTVLAQRDKGSEQALRGEGPTYPMYYVSWDEAMEFCRRLSAKVGGDARLPTEAEWEYACRAGTLTPFHTGETISTSQANYDGQYRYGLGGQGVFRAEATPVATLAANAFGLYDMHGNLWEWCGDWYVETYYLNAPAQDPPGPSKGTRRIIRGGGWNAHPLRCRSANRGAAPPALRLLNIGFRVVVPLAKP